jgi:hypothetical protein
MRTHVIAFLVLLHASLAAAQAPQGDPAGAQAEFAAGQKAFEQKQYGEAAQHFMAAYDKDQTNPLYVFNAAQAYRLDNNCYAAYEAYDTFYKRVEDKPVAGLDTVQQYLRELKPCHDDRMPPQTNPPAQPPPQPTPTATVTQPPPVVAPPPEARPSNGLAYALVAGGVAVVGLAVGAQVEEDSIKSAGDSFVKKCMGPATGSCSSTDLNNHYNNAGRDWSHVADVAYPVGGVALLAGLGLIYLHHNHHSAERMVAVMPTTQGGEVFATWRF